MILKRFLILFGCVGVLFSISAFGIDFGSTSSLIAQNGEQTDQSASEEKADKKENEDVNQPKGFGDLTPEKPPSDQAAEPTQEQKEEAKVEEPKEFRPPETAISKALVDKLFVSTSTVKILSTSGSEGTWRAGGASDVQVGYKLPWTFMPVLQLFGTFRYAPVGISLTADKYSYRGVAVGYLAGVLGNYEFKQNLAALVGVEIGYLVVNLNDLDYYEDKPKIGNGVNFGINTGVEWKILNKKVGVGPRLNVAFGRLSTVQLGGGVSFVF